MLDITKNTLLRQEIDKTLIVLAIISFNRKIKNKINTKSIVMTIIKCNLTISFCFRNLNFLSFISFESLISRRIMLINLCNRSHKISHKTSYHNLVNILIIKANKISFKYQHKIKLIAINYQEKLNDLCKQSH